MKRIDRDNNGFVEIDEMSKWLKEIKRNATLKDSESRWELFQEYSTLDKYLSVNYGALETCKISYELTFYLVLSIIKFIKYLIK